jgi:imidazolonepropionase-like amidohydrolase
MNAGDPLNLDLGQRKGYNQVKRAERRPVILPCWGNGMTCRLGKFLVIATVLLVAVACGGKAEPALTQIAADALVLTHGTVIDGTGSDPIPDGVVVIQGDRIVAVGPALDFAASSAATVIDAGGRTILPGIIDSHVHSTADAAVRREFLTEGVTAVCDLGSPLVAMPLFEQAYIDELPVARGFRAGPILTVPGGIQSAIGCAANNYEVATPEEARAAVVELLERGADVIKIYLDPGVRRYDFPTLDGEQVTAIVEEAHARGALVRAHVRTVPELATALEGGVDAVEHVPLPRFTLIEFESLIESDDPIALFGELAAPELAVLETLLPQMVAQGVVMVPTLGAFSKVIVPLFPRRTRPLIVEAAMDVVGHFHALGGVVALGTDYGMPGLTAGMPVQEMELLLAAGLTPMEVIEASTRHAAYVCGHGDELGTLEPGKLADVIIVDGDPLADIGVMDRVMLVVKGGEIATAAD